MLKHLMLLKQIRIFLELIVNNGAHAKPRLLMQVQVQYVQ